MDILSLKYFLETARTGNMTRAAQNMHVSQPAMSKQIKLLEEELGQALFIRTLHSVTLTQAGQRLKPRAEEIVGLSGKIVSDLALAKGELSGELNIAVVSNGMSLQIAKVFGDFITEHPNLRCSFHNGSLDVLQEMLETGKVDVALMLMSDYTKDFDCLDLNVRRPLGVIMPESDPLAKRSALKAQTLKKLPIIGPVEGTKFSVLLHLPYPYDELDVVATFDDPGDYMKIIRYSGGYILGLEPQWPLLENSGLCFRPIDPRIEVVSCLARNKTTQQNEAVEALFEHFRIWTDTSRF